MKLYAIVLSISMTLVISHPLQESSEAESGNGGKPISEMTSSSASSTQPTVPSSFRRSKLLSSRRRINSKMMVDPQLPSESRIVNYPEPVESSGTYRTTDGEDSIGVRSSRRRRIGLTQRATPLTRAASDQSWKPSSPLREPYIFPISSSSSNIRRATQSRKKVTSGFTVDKKKIFSEKREKEENTEKEISSEGVSLNPPEFEEVRNSPSTKLDMNTIGRLMSNPKKSASLIDLASYRRVANGEQPVFYGNDMLFHREPSYDDEQDDTSRTRNSLSIDPNSEFVLIKK